MRRRLKKVWKILVEEFALLSAELLVVLVLGSLAVAFFLFIAWLLIENRVSGFDSRIYSWITSYTSPAFETFMRTMTVLSNRQFVVFPALAVFVYFLFIRPHRWFSIKVPVVAAGTAILNLILKDLFDRQRPVVNQMVDVGGLSFPSGHAMFSFAFYGLLIYIVWNFVKIQWLRYTLTVLFSLLILFIGASRVYLGVHFATDVIAGFLAGFIWLLVSILSIRYMESRIRRRVRKGFDLPADPPEEEESGSSSI